MPRNSTTYKLGGPKTFRRASTMILRKWGSNLQNIEKSMRAIYEPDGFSPSLEEKCLFWLKTGDYSIFTEEELMTLRVFLQTDQSGAEALIVAYDCVAGDYRQLFIHNVKPHVYVALKLFKDVWKRKMKEHGGLIEDLNMDEICNTSIAELKKNPYWKQLDLLIKDSDNWPLTERYYYLAKQTVHSANYGIEANTFRMNILEKSGGKIVVSKEDGTHFLATYRALFPEIPESNLRIAAQVKETRMLFNLHGHPYTITDYNVLEGNMKDYYAWPRQSTVAEITRIAFSQLQQFIESENKQWDILADTHDSYLLQCPLKDVIEAKAQMSLFMNQRLVSPVDGVEFSMRSESNCGMNWAPQKETNPLGLQELKWN